MANKLKPKEINGKYGYVNDSNYWVIKPKFDFADEFYKDSALVEIGGKCGLIKRMEVIY